ncbi:hypothetical protein PINS_up007916 [Pythium insidiosum]|nr:hypothetical protein PINS_up007916 [Pythium insidiosum]
MQFLSPHTVSPKAKSFRRQLNLQTDTDHCNPKRYSQASRSRARSSFPLLHLSLTPCRRLRARDPELSFVEPKLNTKIRRGDYYGLLKRSSLKHSERPIASDSSGDEGYRRFTRRPVKRISYVLPKLNTKLRQRAFAQQVAAAWTHASTVSEREEAEPEERRKKSIMGCANSKQAESITAAEPVVAHNGVEKRPAPVDAKPAPAVTSAANPPNPNSFEEQYALGKTIGSGTFSVVREAIHKPSGQKYAIKCIKREGLTAEDIEALTTEVAILKQMNHPNIMILHDFFQEEKFYYLVTEFMEGGELFDRIVEKSYYSEREARDLVKLLLESIKYCHDANVVHRDLKPENLLLTSKDDDASIKLADFGFAKKIEFDTAGLATACGTPGYVAPEILEGQQYGKAVDIWSIGVITYILLCGYPPFHDDNHNALFKKIKRGKYQFDSPYWDHVRTTPRTLSARCLSSTLLSVGRRLSCLNTSG